MVDLKILIISPMDPELSVTAISHSTGGLIEDFEMDASSGHTG